MTFHEYASTHADDLTKLTCDMTLIPAPSGHERARAEYCAEWLKNAGAEGVEIDEFCNVVWKAFPGKSGKWIIFSAHTDTVFDFDVPLEIKQVDDKLYIYLEYVSGGSIHKLLQEYGQFGELAIRSYTQQILSGLAFLHAKNTLHR